MYPMEDHSNQSYLESILVVLSSLRLLQQLSQNLGQFVDSSLGAGSVPEYRQNSNQATDPNQAVNRL